MKTFDIGPGVTCDPATIPRFWPKVEQARPGGCWVWTAATNGKRGYGIFRGGIGRDRRGSRRWVLAHRFVFEIMNGPIPGGMEVDHICRNRRCVNPDHLRLLTHRENTLAGVAPCAVQARRSLCLKGHPFDLVTKSGRRRCSICDRAAEAERYVRRYGRVPKPNARRRPA